MEMLIVMFLGMSSWGKGWAGRSGGIALSHQVGDQVGGQFFQQVHSVSRLMTTSLGVPSSTRVRKGGSGLSSQKTGLWPGNVNFLLLKQKDGLSV